MLLKGTDCEAVAVSTELCTAQHSGDLGENPSRVESDVEWSTRAKVQMMLFERSIGNRPFRREVLPIE